MTGSIHVKRVVLPSAHTADLEVTCTLYFPYAANREHGIAGVPEGSVGIATGRSSAERDLQTSTEIREV